MEKVPFIAVQTLHFFVTHKEFEYRIRNTFELAFQACRFRAYLRLKSEITGGYTVEIVLSKFETVKWKE